MSAVRPGIHDLAGNGDANGFDLVHADAALLVLNKPAGLLSVPGKGEDKQDCLSSRVQAHYPEALVVHRLDMATSGLMLMARSMAIQRALGALFERRDIHKRYVAVVNGQPGSTPGTDGWSLIDLPIAVDWPHRPLRIIDAVHGKASQTRWRAVAFDASSNSTRLELEPVTGRSHQLRVHLQALGHPILGDRLYAPLDMQGRAPRLLLHACRLTFIHPVSGEHMQLESPAPF
jgi:tRNA pseudouridine32 synthase/23S rRNA pseudouridine746 synthase